MQKTANYQLNQWEATDKISRADFNADNAAIDAALGELAAAQYVIGSYTGNGKELSDGGLHVELGFRPRFVVISKGWTSASSMSVSTLICTEHPNSGVENYVTFDDTGFTVGLYNSSSAYTLKVNLENNVYDFVALR